MFLNLLLRKIVSMWPFCWDNCESVVEPDCEHKVIVVKRSKSCNEINTSSICNLHNICTFSENIDSWREVDRYGGVQGKVTAKSVEKWFYRTWQCIFKSSCVWHISSISDLAKALKGLCFWLKTNKTRKCTFWKRWADNDHRSWLDN